MKSKSLRITVETVRPGAAYKHPHRAYAFVDVPRSRGAHRCGRGDASSATLATAMALEDLARVLRRRRR